MFVTDPAEQTTALTNVVLALVSFGATISLYPLRKLDTWKVMLWCWSLIVLGLGAVTGAIVHGLLLPALLFEFLWIFVYLFLGLAVALFVINAVNEGWGQQISRRLFPIILVIALVFVGLTRLFPSTFLVFILYEGIAMLCALGIYTWLLVTRRKPGGALIVAGILVTITAAIVQSTNLQITVIWLFDHNGLFHIIQTAAIILLAAGVRQSVLSAKR